tara:strand:- start:171 stop:344 length:174 start_codon:yes stop_codon:yes gene_type:complete
MKVGDLVKLGEGKKYFVGVIISQVLIHNILHYDVMFFEDTLGHIKNLPFYSLETICE